MRGIVAEVPAGLPPDRRRGRLPGCRKLGPLGWIYRYVLVSPAKAAEILAEMDDTPPRHAGRRCRSRYGIGLLPGPRANPTATTSASGETAHEQS